MTKIKWIVGGAAAITPPLTGYLLLDLPGMMAFLFGALLLMWIALCMRRVRRQTVAVVYDRWYGVSVRILLPGIHFIWVPKETIIARPHTHWQHKQGITEGGRTSDGIPTRVAWSVWYQLAPENIPSSFLSSKMDLFLSDTQNQLDTLVGNAVRQLVSKKTAVSLASEEGWLTLNRGFRGFLHSECSDEGFIIRKAAIEGVELPVDFQAALDQVATAEAEACAIRRAGLQYDSMVRHLSSEGLDFIARMEAQRSIRKGGSILNVVSHDEPNH